MRILRLDFGPDIGSADLHPFISVVHGIDEVRRSRLIAAVRSLVAGSGGGQIGLVEHGGHLVEMTGTNQGDLGPFSTEDVVLSIDSFAGGIKQLPQLAAELDQLGVKARIDAVWVEEIRADLVPSAAAEVQRLRDRIDGVAPTIDPGTARLREAIRTAIGTVDGIDRVLKEIPTDIAALIEAWEARQRAEAEARSYLDTIAVDVCRAEETLTEAIRFLTDAEVDAKPLLLSPEEEDRLEDLSHPKIERRFRPRDRSPEGVAEIAALLAKVNQPTYSAYAMYRMNPTPSAERAAVVESARAEVHAARAELDEVRSRADADDTARRLAALDEQIKAEARVIFGPMLPSDLGSALRTKVVERPNPAWDQAARILYDVMTEAGIDVPDSLVPEELPVWADDWLVRQEQADAEIGTVDVVWLNAQLVRAEKALDRHARAMARIDRLEAAAADSRRAVDELTRRIARIETGEVSSAVAMCDAIVEHGERARLDAGVSIPIVVRGNFADLTDDELGTLLDSIEPHAQTVQIILVTDRNAAAQWARDAGIRRALCSATGT